MSHPIHVPSQTREQAKYVGKHRVSFQWLENQTRLFPDIWQVSRIYGNKVEFLIAIRHEGYQGAFKRRFIALKFIDSRPKVGDNLSKEDSGV